MTTFSPYQAFPSPESGLPGQAGPLPVLVAVADAAPQRRLTVFFRIIMLIPHAIVLYFVGIAAAVVAFLGWWGALFTGALPGFAENFLGGYVRWTARVYAYGLLLTDVYPPFSFDEEPGYPVRVAVPPAQRLNRAAVFFRVILMIPAAIVVEVVAFGAGTLMAFIAWLVTLVAGRLPDSFHRAYAAVFRYMTRYNAYWLMLTPAYPGGLYGDVAGASTWADQPPSALTPNPMPPAFGGPAAGPGTPDSVYGAPEGYGYQNPAPGGYGYPAPAPSGYGYPAGYGAQPVAQPAGWLVLLTAAARRLMTVFIVLGALFVVGYIALIAVAVASAGSQADNVVTAQNALDQVSASYSTLTKNLTAWENATKACDGNLTCVTSQDAKAAGDLTTFHTQLAGTPMPPNSVAAAARLDQDTTTAAQGFVQLSKVTTAAQYQSVFTSTGLQSTLNDFDTDYNALVSALESN